MIATSSRTRIAPAAIVLLAAVLIPFMRAANAAAQTISPPADGSSYRAATYDAIRKLRARERAEPASPAVKKALGIAYYAAGQHLLFRAKMAEVKSLDAADPEPDYLLGRHYDSDVEDFAKAAAHLQAAAAGKHPRAAAFLGHALEMLHRTPEAIAAYEDALARSSCDAVALAGLARLGKAAADRLAPCAATARDPQLLRTLARAATAENRHADAAGFLERALAADPNNAPVAYQLHRAWIAAAQPDKAEQALKRYRQLQSIYGGQ